MAKAKPKSHTRRFIDLVLDRLKNCQYIASTQIKIPLVALCVFGVLINILVPLRSAQADTTSHEGQMKVPVRLKQNGSDMHGQREFLPFSQILTTQSELSLYPYVASALLPPSDEAQQQSTSPTSETSEDVDLLYQRAIAEFNAGNTADARLHLRQAHTLIEARGEIVSAEEGETDSFVELHVDGAYNFIPVSRDDWLLQPKVKLTTQESTDEAVALQPRTFRLDTGSVYKLELEPENSSDSKPFIAIQIGLLMVWILAR